MPISSPCARLQPISASICHSSTLRTPSATVTSPSLRPNWMLASTTARLRASPAAPLMKLWSILISVTGSCASCDSDDQPVPKSSTDNPKPLSRRRASTFSACAASCIIADSVSSSVTSCGSTPASCTIAW